MEGEGGSVYHVAEEDDKFAVGWIGKEEQIKVKEEEQ
jgi:hypothetical protein